MGDINLLGMIRKIKNSLSGFVSTSDKASKSAFGIVKVGDNISVSSGKISVPVATESTYGVVLASSGGGVTPTVLYEGNGSNLAYTFPEGKSLTDYNYVIVICNGDCNGSAIIPVSRIVDAGTTGAFVGVIATPTQYLVAKLTTTTPSRHSGQSGVNIIGIYAF